MTSSAGPASMRVGGSAEIALQARGAASRPAMKAMRQARSPAAAREVVAAVPVTTVQARHRDVPEVLDALGTVTPLRSVKLRPQVSGLLMSTRFREGGKVVGEEYNPMDASDWTAIISKVNPMESPFPRRAPRCSPWSV